MLKETVFSVFSPRIHFRYTELSTSISEIHKNYPQVSSTSEYRYSKKSFPILAKKVKNKVRRPSNVNS